MISCHDLTELLPLWVGGDLDEAEARSVDRHLESCPACHEMARLWQRDYAALTKRAASIQPPPLPSARIRAALTAAPATMSRPTGSRRVSALYSLAAAAVLALLIWWGPAVIPPDSPVAVPWQEIQGVFDGCLDEPVPIEQWQASDSAGVVVVLRHGANGGGYILADCLEGPDISAWRRYPWLQQRLRRLEQGDGRLMIAACRLTDADRGQRRQLRRSALAQLRPDLSGGPTVSN